MEAVPHHGLVSQRSQVPLRAPQQHSRLLPGLLVVAGGVATAVAVNRGLPSISALMAALVLGALMTNLGFGHPVLVPGLGFAAKHLLRVGIVLLGLQLAVPEVFALGLPVLLVVLATVTATFFGTLWLGRRLGLSNQRSLLVATGFSICGAAAVAAMDSVAEGEEEDVMAAISLVTIFGSLAIVVLPILHEPLGLTPELFGIWVGASVHEVAQVVATASALGSVALAPAVIVKLTRVVLLAPLVAGVGMWQRRQARKEGAVRTPLVPLFVVGFLAAMLLRSSGVVPGSLLEVAKILQTTLLAAAMFAMGASVRLATVVTTGGRSLVLGLLSSTLVAAVAYLALVAVG